MQRVTLEPMTHAQFSDFMAVILPSYVAERAAADYVSREVAERHARDQHARLLPDAERTTGHRFLNIVSADDDEPVGGIWIWIDVANYQAFLYNITVFSEYRRRGFAIEALRIAEEIVREAQCITLGLNVFSSNDIAMALYRKAGFKAASSYFNKAL